MEKPIINDFCMHDKRLIECNKGEESIVLRVKCGYKAKKRLANLGLVPGIKIVIRQCLPWKGPVEILVKGTSLVIGRGLANKIIVKTKDISTP